MNTFPAKVVRIVVSDAPVIGDVAITAEGYAGAEVTFYDRAEKAPEWWGREVEVSVRSVD